MLRLHQTPIPEERLVKFVSEGKDLLVEITKEEF